MIKTKHPDINVLIFQVISRLLITILRSFFSRMAVISLLHSTLESLCLSEVKTSLKKHQIVIFLWTKWMYLEPFTPLYTSEEQIALLPISLSVYLPLYLFALIRLQMQCPERRGGGKHGCREMRGGGQTVRGQEGQRRRRGGGEWKESRGRSQVPR